MNRLNLNFQLEWRDERNTFIKSYLETLPFTPTSEELDTMAKYILWGKNRETGLNGRQEGLELETRSGLWDSSDRVESLDALIESPAFNEASLRRPSDPPSKLPKQTFSRSTARKNAPSYLLPAFENLWRQIDETELLISLYDQIHEKRKSPIRLELLNRIPLETQSQLKNRASTLTQFHYLKLKHELVDLRTEQYTLKDSYAVSHLSQAEPNFIEDEPPLFGEEFLILPFSIQGDEIQDKIFRTDRFPEPQDFSEEDLRLLSRSLWNTAPPSSLYFDFTNTDHLYIFFEMYEELEEDSDSENSNIREVLKICKSYIELANLEPIHRLILDLKIQHFSNQRIIDQIREKFGRTYQPNYISTLYCQKVLGSIAATAQNHLEVLQNLFFNENFKTCKDCGRTLLLNEKNFVRRQRSSDGFSPRCKKCEKIKRGK